MKCELAFFRFVGRTLELHVLEHSRKMTFCTSSFIHLLASKCTLLVSHYNPGQETRVTNAIDLNFILYFALNG